MNDFKKISYYTVIGLLAIFSSFATANGTESTVVIRVVGTKPSWGQETSPGWINGSPVKDAPGYSLYDLEIGNDANSRPAYLKLYKFSGWQDQPNKYFLLQTGEFWTSSRISSYLISGGANYDIASYDNASTQLLGALKNAVSVILQREKPTRLVIEYSGHGSPDVFFEGALRNSDGQQFLAYVKQSSPNIPLILDFSTNCDVGFFEFASRYYQYADYLLASEKAVGGFDPTSPGGMDSWLANQHDNNMDKFWQSSNSLTQAFDAIVTARQAVWYNGRQSIQSNLLEQSLVVYKLNEFDSLMKSLAMFKGFNPVTDLPTNSNDIATYVYATKNPTLISNLEKFRIRYASDRNIVNWVDDSKGFSVEYPASLSSYLVSINGIMQNDCIFNWAEKNYPQYFSPTGSADATSAPYTYRYYSGTGNYLAVSSIDNNLYAMGSFFGGLLNVGAISTWLSTAGCQ